MYTSHILVFAVLFCLVTVNARYHAEPLSDTEELARTDDQPTLQNVQKSRGHGQRRHRRKRWQMNQGYNYPPPAQPFYEERRDYYGQPDLQAQILRLLDELSAYVKRPQPPPPPPQPIYVPYPVPYPVPQYQCNCKSPQNNNKTGVPSLGTRVKMDDNNQNWGFTDYEDVDNAKYDRPISFTPSRPSASGRAPESSRSTSKKVPLKVSPQTCDAAVLSCCRPSDSRQQKFECFTSVGCGSRFSDTACDQEAVDKVLELFTKAYSPTATF